MVKSGLGLFAGRRKSQSNVLEDGVDAAPAVAKPPPAVDSGSGGFRVMTATEADARKREEKRRASEKAASKFRPFSGFGNNGSKGRNHSFDDESPGSSKRDSKSSSGTGGSRPYNNGQFGSTSTLPSSADAHSDDNIFAVPRPPISHQQSAPNALTTKQLPAVPQPNSRYYGSDHNTSSETGYGGRVRAMTSSSYASTAKPPTLDADLNFGSSSFDDMFSGIERKESPEMTNNEPGRSLLQGKRHFQAEPIHIDRKLDVEPPLTSWDSRDSTENLMSPHSVDDDSPPPPPPHKFSHSHQQQYAPVASHSPNLSESNGFVDNSNSNARSFRQSVMAPNPLPSHSPERTVTESISSSSAHSLQTPLSSHSGSSHTTPKAATHPPFREDPGGNGDDEDDLFAPPKPSEAKPAAPVAKEARPPPRSVDESGRRIMTQAEFRAQQQRATQQPASSDSDEEDYEEDEEDAEERAAQEAIARRKKQQMDLARDSMRRTTTVPTNGAQQTRPDSVAEALTMGFPSEVSLKADEWEDEDIPLGILAQHGFPSTARNKLPSQPLNATPSYYRNSNGSLGIPERPASAGPLGNRASTFRPAFARNLPDDPHASFVGAGLIQPSNRESMGFSRGPASVIGEPVMGYPEPHLSAPSLVDQIHMRDMSKQKYMGGASSKKPQAGPFTGLMGAQMNNSLSSANTTRMSMMNPGMNGMNGMGMGMGMGMNAMNPMNQMNQMNPMMGMMGAANGMPMMGMNGMAYPAPQNDYMQQMQHMQQMQQMIATQQMQLQQMQAMSQQQQQNPQMHDPRMSLAMPNNFLTPNGPPGQRPMSVMSSAMGGQQQNFPPLMPPNPQQQPPPRPYSSGANLMGNMSPFPAPSLGPMPGYTPSIAPSERSNIGLSARYRPVATNNDTKSTVSSSMTLQASSGAMDANNNANNSNNNNNNKRTSGLSAVKGILKKGNNQPQQQPVVEEEDEDGWGKLAQRKGKFGLGNKGKGGGGKKEAAKDGDDELRDIVRGIDAL